MVIALALTARREGGGLMLLWWIFFAMVLGLLSHFLNRRFRRGWIPAVGRVLSVREESVGSQGVLYYARLEIQGVAADERAEICVAARGSEASGNAGDIPDPGDEIAIRYHPGNPSIVERRREANPRLMWKIAALAISSAAFLGYVHWVFAGGWTRVVFPAVGALCAVFFPGRGMMRELRKSLGKTG